MVLNVKHLLKGLLFVCVCVCMLVCLFTFILFILRTNRKYVKKQINYIRYQKTIP